MALESRLTLLLPTLNERENICLQIREVLSALPAIGEILVVDDNSGDGTREAVAEAFPEAVAEKRIRVIHRTQDLGLTNSLRDGVAAARGEWIGWMDCDLSMPSTTLPQLLQAIEDGADVALGSRFLRGGERKQLREAGNDSRAEIILSWLLNRTLRVITRAPVTDFTSGFIVIQRAAIQNFRWRGSHGEYFIYLMADSHAAGRRIVEIPYRCGNRKFGESKTFGNWKAVYRNSYRYLYTLWGVMREKTAGI